MSNDMVAPQEHPLCDNCTHIRPVTIPHPTQLHHLVAARAYVCHACEDFPEIIFVYGEVDEKASFSLRFDTHDLLKFSLEDGMSMWEKAALDVLNELQEIGAIVAESTPVWAPLPSEASFIGSFVVVEKGMTDAYVRSSDQMVIFRSEHGTKIWSWNHLREYNTEKPGGKEMAQAWLVLRKWEREQGPQFDHDCPNCKFFRRVEITWNHHTVGDAYLCTNHPGYPSGNLVTAIRRGDGGVWLTCGVDLTCVDPDDGLYSVAAQINAEKAAEEALAKFDLFGTPAQTSAETPVQTSVETPASDEILDDILKDLGLIDPEPAIEPKSEPKPEPTAYPTMSQGDAVLMVHSIVTFAAKITLANEVTLVLVRDMLEQLRDGMGGTGVKTFLSATSEVLDTELHRRSHGG